MTDAASPFVGAVQLAYLHGIDEFRLRTCSSAPKAGSSVPRDYHRTKEFGTASCTGMIGWHQMAVRDAEY
ncbi:MAG: hypothetical protein OEU78_05545 [Gammaproteobacteria bacterium]|nr:hypothetical protein [Gammaproteobacteria bacterium]MDH3972119.1 hypothetical protein [Gammaproteobacteria bacterium]